MIGHAELLSEVYDKAYSRNDSNGNLRAGEGQWLA